MALRIRWWMALIVAAPFAGCDSGSESTGLFSNTTSSGSGGSAGHGGSGGTGAATSSGSSSSSGGSGSSSSGASSSSSSGASSSSSSGTSSSSASSSSSSGVVNPLCGDGNVDYQSGEECDDGNNTSGDGCSAACAIEAA